MVAKVARSSATAVMTARTTRMAWIAGVLDTCIAGVLDTTGGVTVTKL